MVDKRDKKNKKNRVDLDDINLPALNPFSSDLERDVNETVKKKDFLIAFQENSSHNLGKALRLANVSRRLFTSWLEVDQDFKATYQEIEMSRIDDVQQTVFDLATKDEVPDAIKLKAATTYLKAKSPDEWGDKSSGSSSGPAQIIFVIGKEDPKILDDGKTIDVKAR